MHFTYKDPFSAAELCQGDVLARTPEIDALLKLVHPHFYSKADNLFFMVLTQSCDLVLRGDSANECKAPYITIAPVRPIEYVLKRQIAALQSSGINADLPVLTDKAKTKLSEFLQRIYNNNEQGYFFLESSGTSLPSDCCAYLNLSIAIRASDHFKVCLAAKRLQLTDTFQAKLGWLVGQMYSRVGTQDWERKALSSKIQSTIQNSAIWIPEAGKKALEDAFKPLKVANVEARMTELQIKEVLGRVQTKKLQVLNLVSVALTNILSNTLNDDVKAGEISKRIIRRLEGDAAFTSLTK
jgi:hypothetical protein